LEDIKSVAEGEREDSDGSDVSDNTEGLKTVVKMTLKQA
jgi:hypothetical protein